MATPSVFTLMLLDGDGNSVGSTSVGVQAEVDCMVHVEMEVTWDTISVDRYLKDGTFDANLAVASNFTMVDSIPYTLKDITGGHVYWTPSVANQGYIQMTMTEVTTCTVTTGADAIASFPIRPLVTALLEPTG